VIVASDGEDVRQILERHADRLVRGINAFLTMGESLFAIGCQFCVATFQGDR
jgi:hypothetical protein